MTRKQRQQILDLLIDHDARDADLLVRKIEKILAR